MIDYEKAKTAIRRPWVSVFMDGRNEHGTHLLPIPPDGLCLSEKHYQELLDSHSEEVERVFSDAESAGYGVGCCVIVSCTACEDECGVYFELSKLDEDLTHFIHGEAQEQLDVLKDMATASR